MDSIFIRFEGEKKSFISDINCLLYLTVLPVMLSSKLLPEMEMDDNSKKEQLLLGMQNLPVAVQIEKLKVTHSLTKQ